MISKEFEIEKSYFIVDNTGQERLILVKQDIGSHLCGYDETNKCYIVLLKKIISNSKLIE